MIGHSALGPHRLDRALGRNEERLMLATAAVASATALKDGNGCCTHRISEDVCNSDTFQVSETEARQIEKVSLFTVDVIFVGSRLEHVRVCACAQRRIVKEEKPSTERRRDFPRAHRCHCQNRHLRAALSGH